MLTMAILTKHFAGREEAANLICKKLTQRDLSNALVLGIPRGGVVLADTIAQTLDCDLDIVLAQKIGAPANPELAVGAVCENGNVCVNHHLAREVGADDEYIEREKACQLGEIRRRQNQYRRILSRVSPADRIVVVVDDGVATGATMQATLWALDAEAPRHTIAAVPVGAPRAIERLSREADEVVCLIAPDYLASISQFYQAFPQVDDREVLDILRTHQGRRAHTE